MKKMIPVILFSTLVMGNTSFAACEKHLTGFKVDLVFTSGDGTPALYYSVSSEHLGIRATIVARESECTSIECKKMSELLYDIAHTDQLIKLGVSPEVCDHLRDYTTTINGGSSFDVLSIQKITSVELGENVVEKCCDTNFHFGCPK